MRKDWKIKNSVLDFNYFWAFPFWQHPKTILIPDFFPEYRNFIHPSKMSLSNSNSNDCDKYFNKDRHFTRLYSKSNSLSNFVDFPRGNSNFSIFGGKPEILKQKSKKKLKSSSSIKEEPFVESQELPFFSQTDKEDQPLTKNNKD